MPATVSFMAANGQDVQSALRDALNVMPSSTAMLYAASRQIARIRQRTRQGNDVNGQPFQPYSAKYAKVRVKEGRHSSPVDLLWSGRLLNSMQAEVRGKTEFAITVMDVEAATYGRAHNEGEGHMPRRRFFDTSQAEQQEMQKDLFGFDLAEK